jgi:alpha-beta hydrolase superfamily lysophospholipase
LSGCPTIADVRRHAQCIEATETHLPVYVWQETTQHEKGVVLLLHGIAESAYTLDHLAQQLVSSGFLVYGLDERGHGWWHFHQNKGDPGYNCDFTQTVIDVDKLLSVMGKEHPGLPLFMIGESVGAAVAWRAAVDNPDAVDGIVVASTGCRAGRAKIIWVIGDFLRGCWRWNHQINIMRYELRYSTDDLPTFEENFKEPEQRETLTLSEIVGANRFLRENRKFARRLNPHIAVLVIQGSDDHVLSCKSAMRVFDAANSSDKRLVVVPGGGHVLLGMNRLKPLVHDSITTFLNAVAFRRTDARPPKIGQDPADLNSLVEAESAPPSDP